MFIHFGYLEEELDSYKLLSISVLDINHVGKFLGSATGPSHQRCQKNCNICMYFDKLLCVL